MRRLIASLSVVGTLLILGVAAVSCRGTVDSTQEKGTGTLRVLVTDKPFPFEFIKEAKITITRVEVRRAGGAGACESAPACDDNDLCTVDSCDPQTGDCVFAPLECEEGDVCNGVACVPACTDDAGCDDEVDCTDDACVEGLCVNTPVDCQDDGDDDDDGDGLGPWLVIFEGERTFNLLDLQNGRTDLLADTTVEAGTYTQMRLIVTEGEVVLDNEDTTRFPLRVPSGSQTGIKLHFEFGVEANDETTLILDVDVSKAFLPVPGGRIEDVSTIREFKFKPSLAMRLINVLDAGSIAGIVTDPEANPLADVAVTVFAGDNELTSTATEADGTYLAGGLATGTYRVEFSLAGYEDASVPDISVTAGQTTQDVNAELIAAP